MKHLFSFLIICATALSAFSQDFEKQEVIVMLQPKTSPQYFIQKVNQNYPNLQTEIKETLSKRLNIYLVGVSKNQTEFSALEKMKEFQELVVGQLNYTGIEQRDSVPNDPSYFQQWCHTVMNSEYAWAKNKGGVTANGDTLVVAVVDGGNQPHDDLDFFINRHEIPNNGIDDDNNGYVDDYSGWNAYNDNGNVPSDYHGNHVAGIIGAIGNNDVGVSGVNWNMKIMGIAGSSSNQSTVVKAYDYAYTMRKIYNETNGDSGAYVVSTNSSFGRNQADPNNYPLWCAFYDSLGTVGILSAGATANANFDIDAVGDMPTACSSDYLIAVTNTTSVDAKNGGAAYGKTTIDIGAPGTNIYSTGINNAYGSSTGTSMATPQIAGAIALMYANICDLMFQEYAGDPAGLAMELKDILLTQGFDTVPALQNITVTGGRLNLNKAVAAVNEHCRVLSIRENKKLGVLDLEIYPNPSNGLVNFTSTSKAPIEVFDLNGRLVKEIIPMNTNSEIELNSGVYMVRQKDIYSVSTQKLIVK